MTAPLGTGFTYSIDGTNYQTSPVFAGVAAGPVSVYVENATGCASLPTALNVDAAPGAPAAPTASVTTEPTCTLNTGTVTVTAPLGTGFTYSIDGTNYQTSPVFAGVASGPVSVTVQSGGCTSLPTNLNVDDAPGAPAAPTASVTTEPTCALNTGTVTVTAPLGTGFTYSIDGTNYQTSPVFAGVASGPVSVTVQGGGCTSLPTNLNVDDAPGAPAAPTASVTTEPTCALNTGTVTVTAPLGTGFTYSIDGTNYQTSPVFAGVAAGPVSVYVENATGCASLPTALNVDAAPGAPAAPTASVTTEPTCTLNTGTVTVTAPLGTGFTYSIDGTNYQTSPVFAGVASGPVSVTVQSGGCTSLPTNLNVDDAPGAPAAPTASVTTEPTCALNTGTVTVTAPLGAGFTYSIDGTNYQTSPVFAGVASGPVSVTVQSGGCTSLPTNLNVDDAPGAPAAPTASVTTEPTCALNTGTVTVTAPLGTGFTYSIDGTNYQTSPVFAGVASGPVSVTVQSGGCTSLPTNLNVDDAPGAPAAPTASVTTEPTCALNTGTVTVTAPLGTGFTYSIDGTNYQTSPVFAGVAAGPVSVYVENATGCASLPTALNVDAAPGAPAAPTASVTTEPTCTLNTGTVTVTAPLGTGFTYSIDGTNYQTSPVFAGVASGPVSVTVQSGGCTSLPTNLNVDDAPGAPAAPTASVTTEPTCALNTGTVTVTAPLGAGFTYSIDGTNYQTSPVFAGVASGPVSVTVQSGGCTSLPTNLNVDDAPGAPAAPTASVTTEPTCALNTGTVTVTAPLGTGFTYSIDGTNYQTSPVFAGVASGPVSVTVQSGGCTSLPTNLNVDDAPGAPAAPTASVTTEPTCALNTGTVTVTAPLGTGFTYSIDGTNYQTSPVFAGVAAGPVSVYVENATGCASLPTALNVDAAPGAPAAPTASVTTEPTCALNTGTVTVTAPLGAGFTYSIDGTNYQTSPVFAGVASGPVSVTVQSGGCTSLPTNLNVDDAPTPPAAPTASVTTEPTCALNTGTVTVTAPLGAGFTYSIDGTNYQTSPVFAGVASGPVSVTVQSGGCTSLPTNLNVDDAPGAPAAPTASVTTEPTCALNTGTVTVTAPLGTGFTYSIDGTNYQTSPVFAGVAAGPVSVYVENATGCASLPTALNVDAAPGAPAAPTASVTTEPTCALNTGTVTVTAPLGTGFTYSIDGTNYQTSPVFAGVAAGPVSVYVENATGCASLPTALNVDAAPGAPAAPTASVTTEPTCALNTGTVTVTAPLGTGFTYSIDGTNYQTSPVFAGVAAGPVSVYVENATGCASLPTALNVDAAPGAPAAPTASVTTEPTCALNTGTVTVTAPLGTGFTYSIDGTNYQTSPVFAGVAAGPVSVYVENATGCASLPTALNVDAAPGAPAALDSFCYY